MLFGHYWYEGEPNPEESNVACLDYSVPRPSGRLTSYRWSGEMRLDAGNYKSVGNMTGPY